MNATQNELLKKLSKVCCQRINCKQNASSVCAYLLVVNMLTQFFGVTIAALGGVLLLKNLEIVKFDSWHLFWGTVWAVGLVLAGLTTIISSRKMLTRAWGLD